jgi:hypothetical protein
MIFVNRYEFYSEVVNGNHPIKDIFSSLSASLSSDDFDSLFNEFSTQLSENFDSYKKGEIAESKVGKYKMSKPIFKRVRLSIFLLMNCALGSPFNDYIYNLTIDFILRKELCSVPLILN